MRSFRVLAVAAAAAAVSAAASVPGLAAPASAAPARHAAPALTSRHAVAATRIKHIVVLFMENHSFDSLLGFWCDAHPGRCPDGGMPASVTLSDGATVTPTRDPSKVPAVVHNVQAQIAAMDGGKMDGWQNIPRGQCDAAVHYRCISGYEPAQIPNISSLATRFAISDKTFSVTDSGSWEGHLAIAAASGDGFYGDNPGKTPGVTQDAGWGCDSNDSTLWSATPGGTLETVPSCVPDYALKLPYGGAFEKTPVKSIPTIFQRLDAAGLSWNIFGSPKGSKGYGYWDICPSLASCRYTKEFRHLVSDDHFTKDAAAGTLPAFSIVTPGGTHWADSCHNSMSITRCDNWIGQLAGAVEKSPDWSSTAVFLTFDDFGGFYDQVPPPLEPDGSQEGPRVPLIIVSPYARAGYTDTTGTTFAGIIAYTEQTFGLAPLGVNDANAYDFSNAFNYSQTPLKPVPMVTRRVPAWALHQHFTKAQLEDPT
jgi:phospholipase C